MNSLSPSHPLPIFMRIEHNSLIIKQTMPTYPQIYAKTETSKQSTTILCQKHPPVLVKTDACSRPDSPLFFQTRRLAFKKQKLTRHVSKSKGSCKIKEQNVFRLQNMPRRAFSSHPGKSFHTFVTSTSQTDSFRARN